MLMSRNSQSIQAYRHEMKNFKDKIIDNELGYDQIKNLCKPFISYLSFDKVQNDTSGRRRLEYLNYSLNKELKK
ncbi:hypothetical protein PCYB_001290 [Plasmodium cynomolgi strain B]|uniref:Uncharacterized protein n=1 Tax=Plasmodium cynomolgi (strain B) TaxID=1120755 RepID=K6UF29_PLACD|nr:hypothetical protein PCYB_001290 [Plasmodium cynomolgi strain B]GAB69381.1 hypothetical protein PCYB_001290 [Plasmodium cynomolgi strain B]